MAEDEGEGREKRPEDLFEDLGTFFAPIQGEDWPVPASDEGAEEPEPAKEAAGPWGPLEEAVERPMGAGDLGSEPEAARPAEPAQEREEPPAAPSEEGSYRESLTEEELPLIEAGGETEGLEEYLPEEEPTTVVVGDEGAGVEKPVDTEAAAEHFAATFREEPAAEDILSDLEEVSESVTVKVGAAEGLHGPSWQEPTSEEVGAEAPTPGAGRDLPTAVLTGVILAVLGLGSLAIGRPAFAVVAGLLVLAAQGEVYAAIERRHRQPATALGLVAGALILAGGYFHGEPGAVAMFALSVVFTFIWYMSTAPQHRVNVMTGIALTLLGIVWIPFLGSSIMVLLAIEPPGRALALSVLGMVFVYDTVAFAVGSLWGDHPLAPTVSPRKSREGAIAATLAIVIVAFAGVARIEGVGFAGAAWLTLVVAVFAPLGDLAESLIKRDLGVKDMGSVLPGHGGVLDRIDSVLFVAPAALVVLRMVLLG